MKVSLGEAHAKPLPWAPWKSFQTKEEMPGQAKALSLETQWNGRDSSHPCFYDYTCGTFHMDTKQSAREQMCITCVHRHMIAGEEEAWLTLTLDE